MPHEDANYSEWGAVRIAPGADGRGLSLTLSPAGGADADGAVRLWSLTDARGLAPKCGADERPAGPLLREPEPNTDTVDAGGGGRRAQQFPRATSARICLASVRSETARRRARLETDVPGFAVALKSDALWVSTTVHETEGAHGRGEHRRDRREHQPSAKAQPRLNRLGPVNTYLSASKMSTKWMKPMNITSSFSNRENIRR